MRHQLQLKFYSFRCSTVEWGLIIIFCFLQTFRTDPLPLNAIEQVVENFIRNFAIVFKFNFLLVFPMNLRIVFSFVIFGPFLCNAGRR